MIRNPKFKVIAVDRCGGALNFESEGRSSSLSFHQQLTFYDMRTPAGPQSDDVKDLQSVPPPTSRHVEEDPRQAAASKH